MRINVEQLIQGLGLEIAHGDEGMWVTELTDDSRKVVAGGLFIARPGAKGDGSDYVSQAIEKGAGAVVRMPLGSSVRESAEILGQIAMRFYGDPARRMKLIGITGTNGKTTTAYLVKYIIESYGKKCGLLGTVSIEDGEGVHVAELTTPGTLALYRWLKVMADNGCGAAVMEMSSHALDQFRHAGLKFQAGVFTNLTGDHLDYHKDMATYASAKSLLFESLAEDGLAVVNGRDQYGGHMVSGCSATLVQSWVGTTVEREMRESGAGKQVMGMVVSGVILEMDARGSRVLFEMGDAGFECRLPLVGEFNVSNALQAMLAAGCAVMLDEKLQGILERCPAVPGRLEEVKLEAGNTEEKVRDKTGHLGRSGAKGVAQVFVDYAHTHDALDNVLRAVGEMMGKAFGYGLVGVDEGAKAGGRLWVVFGCGGDRDTSKRAKMGRVAAELADVVVVTSDNPRTEEPGGIIRQICEGVCGESFGDAGGEGFEGDFGWEAEGLEVKVMADRGEAIAWAVANAGAGDVVVIAGKGHEDYQILGTEKIDFDDRVEARKAMEKRVGR